VICKITVGEITWEQLGQGMFKIWPEKSLARMWVRRHWWQNEWIQGRDIGKVRESRQIGQGEVV
jgi:hypothetical protein